jgi:hypothetical protein
MSEELLIPIVLQSENLVAPDELYKLALALRRELLNQPVVSVTHAQNTTSEKDAKGLGLNETQLLVTLSAQVVPALILLLSNWLLRQKDQRIHIKIGATEIDIPINTPPAQLEKIVQTLIKADKQIK